MNLKTYSLPAIKYNPSKAFTLVITLMMLAFILLIYFFYTSSYPLNVLLIICITQSVLLLFFLSKIPRRKGIAASSAFAPYSENEQFRLLVNNVNDYAIFMIDPEGTIMTWNKGAERIKGYRKEEVIGKSFKLFYTKDDLANGEPENNLQLARKYGQFEKEGWRVKKDGTHFWANVLFTPLWDEGGRLYGYSKITRDNTEKRKTQEQLEFLSLQISQSNDAIYSVNEAGNIETWNKGAENMYGFTLAEMKGQNVNLMLQTDISAKNMQLAMNEIDMDGYSKGEMKRRHKSGEEIFIQASITAVKDASLKIIGYVSVNVDITTQKKMQEEISHLARIVEQSSEAIMSRGNDKKFISWNHGAEEMFGYTKAEAIGKGVLELGFANLSTEDIKEVEQEIEKTGSWRSERNFTRKDGSNFFGTVTGNYIRNEENLNDSFYFIVKDISVRKLYEEQLKRSNEELEEKVKERTREIIASERKFRALIENNNDIISMVDEKFQVLYRSPSAHRITGWSNEEIALQSAMEIIHPEDREGAVKGVSKIMDQPGVIFRTLSRHKHKEGHYLWMEGTVVNLLQDEDIKAIVFNFRDVTERKEAEAKLVTSEVRFRSLIENTSDAIVLNDADFNILYQSPSVAKILGYNYEERQGKKTIDFIHPDYHPSFLKLYEQLRHTDNTPLPFLYKYLHKNGKYIWLEGVVANMLKNPAVKAFVANYRDATERIEADAKIKKLNTELEEKVLLRTEQLKRTNEELEAFSYSVSHDLRAPLRAIVGFTAILEEDYANRLDEEARRITGIIKNNTVKMGQLIDGLLSFSRLGRQEIVRVNIDNNLLVKEIIETINKEPSPPINWQLHNLHPIKADLQTLRQVWVNLISNAVKYSAKSDPSVIEIGSYIRTGYTVFFVKDNGVGFDSKYKDKLFKVFQRLHSVQDFEGTGIGLALVEKVISKHNGTVWAEATPGKGACFFFSIPAYA